MQTQIEKPLIIPRVPAGEEAKVAGIFSAVEQNVGFVPDALRLLSFSPTLLENFVATYGYFNSGERIPERLMTMIRYLVSWGAKCKFCIDTNESFLTNMGMSLDEVRAARDNIELASFGEKEKTLIRIAVKSVNAPEAVSSSDISAARKQGWSDRDIFDAVAQATNMRALNMMLRTFKLEQQGAFS